MIYKTIEKLRDPEYRKAFVASQINIGIPFQIRGLLQSRGWKQEDLVKRTGMLQPRISALLTPGKVRPNIETLRRIAEAFDCGLQVRFVPFSEQVRWSESFNPEDFNVPSFAEEVEHVERWEDSVPATLGDLVEPQYASAVEGGRGMPYSHGQYAALISKVDSCPHFGLHGGTMGGIISGGRSQEWWNGSLTQQPNYMVSTGNFSAKPTVTVVIAEKEKQIAA